MLYLCGRHPSKFKNPGFIVVCFAGTGRGGHREGSEESKGTCVSKVLQTVTITPCLLTVIYFDCASNVPSECLPISLQGADEDGPESARDPIKRIKVRMPSDCFV